MTFNMAVSITQKGSRFITSFSGLSNIRYSIQQRLYKWISFRPPVENGAALYMS